MDEEHGEYKQNLEFPGATVNVVSHIGTNNDGNHHSGRAGSLRMTIPFHNKIVKNKILDGIIFSFF